MAWYKMTAYEFAKTAQTAELCRLFFFYVICPFRYSPPSHYLSKIILNLNPEIQ